MLKSSFLGREHNPIRCEIHGNVRKILKIDKAHVSDMFSIEFEEQLKEALLAKYRQLKKWEPIKISGTRRCDSLIIALALYQKNTIVTRRKY